MMYDGDKIVIRPLTVGFAIVQLIVTVLIVAGFQAVLADDRVSVGVGVSGLQQEIVGLPDSSKEKIEFQIYQAVAKNSGTENIKDSGVEIRSGSLINTYYDSINVHYASFIADIPGAEQSYRVFHEWSDDAKNEYISPDMPVGVVCLDKSELVYGEFDCDPSNDYLKKAMVYNMIYALGYMSPGSDLNLVMVPESYASSLDFKVKLYYRECVTMCSCVSVSNADRLAALQKFDNLVSSLGFKSSDIPYYFDNCEGGM